MAAPSLPAGGVHQLRHAPILYFAGCPTGSPDPPANSRCGSVATIVATTTSTTTATNWNGGKNFTATRSAGGGPIALCYSGPAGPAIGGRCRVAHTSQGCQASACGAARACGLYRFQNHQTSDALDWQASYQENKALREGQSESLLGAGNKSDRQPD